MKSVLGLPNNSSTLTANFLGTAIGTGFPELESINVDRVSWNIECHG